MMRKMRRCITQSITWQKMTFSGGDEIILWIFTDAYCSI